MTVENISITYVHEQETVFLQLFDKDGKELAQVGINWPAWVHMNCKMQADRVQSELQARQKTAIVPAAKGSLKGKGKKASH